MKLWQALDKAVKGLKIKFKGVRRKYEIKIEDDPWIVITKLVDSKYTERSFGFDMRDWEKIKTNIDNLINKEI